MNLFMVSLTSKIGNHSEPLFNPISPKGIYYDAFDDDPSEDSNDLPYGDELMDAKEHEIDEPYLDSLDKYIGAKVIVPGKDAIPVLAEIRGRKRDSTGNPVGVEHPNPILDSRVYELEFPDGRVEEYSMNTIVENLVAQTDDDGCLLKITCQNLPQERCF